MSNKNALVKSAISLLISVLLGAALIAFGMWVPATTVINFLFIVLGVIIVVMNIPGLISGVVNLHKKGGLTELILSILGVILGVLLIFYHGIVVNIAIAVYFIVFPIIRIITSKKWKNALKSEWLKILIGVLLIVLLPLVLGVANEVVKWILIVAGAGIILLGLISFVLSLLGKKK